MRSGIQLTDKDGIVGSKNDAFKTTEKDVQVTNSIVPGSVAGGSPKPASGTAELFFNLSRLVDQLVDYFTDSEDGRSGNENDPEIENGDAEDVKNNAEMNNLRNRPQPIQGDTMYNKRQIGSYFQRIEKKTGKVVDTVMTDPDNLDFLKNK